MELSQILPAEATSAAAARRLTEDALRAWRREGLVEVATLLVSELVTNAVLHAGSDIDLRVTGAGGGVRVEVGDASAALPVRRAYGRQSMTGRGLGLVELLATSWGAEPRPAGKIVWCHIEEPGAPQLSEEDLLAAFDDVDGVVSSPDIPDVAPSGAGVDVMLRSLPVALYRAMLQHNDALLREWVLCGLGAGAVANAGTAEAAGTSAEEAVRPAASIGALATRLPLRAAGVEAAVQAAYEADEPTIDLRVPVGTEAREACSALLVALDEADGLAGEGRLLVPAALPEIRACRQWCLGEVIAQIDGAAPKRFHAPAVAPTTVAPLRALDPAVVLDSLHDAVVVGDDENRIRYVNPAVERLLGWSAAELVGQRITVIVPAHLREAHVVGYTRHLVTAEPRLIGRPVRVPARHRSGREVDVELLLSAFRAADGRRMFVGSLREVATDARREPTLTTAGALAATSDIAAMFHAQPAGPASAAAEVLSVVGRRLRCEVGLLWQPDAAGEELACVASWDDGSSSGAGFRGATLNRRFRAGIGIPGRVWESGQPVWVPDVVGDTNFTRAGLAVEHGLRSALAFPVVAAGEVTAVVEFLSSGVLEVNADVLAIVSAIGRQLGAYPAAPA